jgi:hypothetical protein
MGFQEFHDQAKAFFPPPAPFPSIDNPDAGEHQQTNQRSNAQGANDFDGGCRRENRHAIGKIVQQDGAVAKARKRQHRQKDHDPGRAAHASFIALDLGNSFAQKAAFDASVILDAPRQKRRFSVSFGTHRFPPDRSLTARFYRSPTGATG